MSVRRRQRLQVDSVSLCCALLFQWLFCWMTFEEVLDIKQGIHDGYILLDCRETCYFNGWPEIGFRRGGRIPNSVDFSFCWLDSDFSKYREHSLQDIVMDKGIHVGSKVVAYSSNLEQAIKVAMYLTTLGVSDVKLFNSTGYYNDDSNPLISYVNYRSLLHVDALKSLLSGIEYDSISPHGLKYFEVSYGDESVEYQSKGHIPGAVHIDTNEIEFAPLWQLRDDEQLFQFLANNGIVTSDRIVLSGYNVMASCRMAMILKYLGLTEVYVLDGGTAAYMISNGQLEFTSHAKTPCAINDIMKRTLPGLIDTIQDVESFICNSSSGSKVLLDVRTEEEYSGTVAGYSDLRYKGHVRGAVFHGGSRSTNCQTVYDYTNPDGTMRNFSEVLHMWKHRAYRIDDRDAKDPSGADQVQPVSIDPQTVKVSLMCGSGWRTSQILFYCHVYGLTDRVSMYSNGWYEWSALHYKDVSKTCKHSRIDDGNVDVA